VPGPAALDAAPSATNQPSYAPAPLFICVIGISHTKMPASVPDKDKWGDQGDGVDGYGTRGRSDWRYWLMSCVPSVPVPTYPKDADAARCRQAYNCICNYNLQFRRTKPHDFEGKPRELRIGSEALG